MALSGLFVLLHNITSREHRHYTYPRPEEEAQESYCDVLSCPLDSRSNDGIVPTLSQIRGRTIDIVIADHLGIVGQFRSAGADGLIAPTPAAMRAYDDEIQRALSGTVWATSCRSWYKREDGRITALYPYDGRTWRRRHRRLRREHFEIGRAQ